MSKLNLVYEDYLKPNTDDSLEVLFINLSENIEKIMSKFQSIQEESEKGALVAGESLALTKEATEDMSVLDSSTTEIGKSRRDH